MLGRGFAWLDTGTHKSLLEAAKFVQIIEDRQGLKIACLEEIALNNGWLSKQDMQNRVDGLKNNRYARYLMKVIREQ